jgi:hypothetical protein
LKEGRYIDLDEQVMLLYDAAAANDVAHQTLMVETSPAGINIFALLNLPMPPNVTNLEGWKVIMSSNSSSYGNITQILEVKHKGSENNSLGFKL